MTDKFINANERIDSDNANRDPNSGVPETHPIGDAVSSPVGGVVAGITAGAAMGAAAGTIVGPVGTVIGAAVGAVVGGLAGKSATEGSDPMIEDAYWRENYATRPYISGSGSYDDYGPAYGVGTNAHTQYAGKSFDEIEPHLSRDWSTNRGKSNLDWANAKEASRDAWNRVSDSVERAVPGDSDRDGK